MGIPYKAIVTGALCIGSFVAALIMEHKRRTQSPQPVVQPTMNPVYCEPSRINNIQDPTLRQLYDKYCGNRTVSVQQTPVYNNAPVYQQPPQPQQQYYCDTNTQPVVVSQQPTFTPSPNLNPVMNQPVMRSEMISYNKPVSSINYGYGYNDDANNRNAFKECIWNDESNNSQMYNSNGNGFSYYNNDYSNYFKSSYPYNYNVNPGMTNINNSQMYNSNGNGFSYYNDNTGYNYTTNQTNQMPINMQVFYDNPINLSGINGQMFRGIPPNSYVA